MQPYFWYFLVNFGHPAPPPKKKSRYVKYIDFLDNLITLFTHSLCCANTLFNGDSQYMVGADLF